MRTQGLTILVVMLATAVASADADVWKTVDDGDPAFGIVKADPGVETIRPVDPDWCEGYAGELRQSARSPEWLGVPPLDEDAPGSKWPSSNYMRFVAWAACDARPGDRAYARRKQWVAYWRQAWANLSGAGDAEQRVWLRYFVRHHRDEAKMHEQLCAGSVAPASGDVLVRAQRIAELSALRCPTQNIDSRRLMSALDRPGVEPSAILRLFAAQICLANSQLWPDYGFCSYDLAHLDKEAWRKEAAALATNPLATVRLETYLVQTERHLQKTMANWKQGGGPQGGPVELDRLALVEAATRAHTAWASIYAAHRELIDASSALVGRLEGHPEVASVAECDRASQRLTAYLRSQQPKTRAEVETLLQSPPGWHLARAALACDVATKRVAFVRGAPTYPVVGPRHLAAYFVAVAQQQQKQSSYGVDALTLTARGAELGESSSRDIIDRIKSVQPKGNDLLVTFERDSVVVEVDINCKRTGRLSRVDWQTGNIYYEAHCDKGHEKLDRTLGPVRIPKVYGAGLAPGRFLVFKVRMTSDDSYAREAYAFPVAVFQDAKLQKLEAAYGAALR